MELLKSWTVIGAALHMVIEQKFIFVLWVQVLKYLGTDALRDVIDKAEVYQTHDWN